MRRTLLALSLGFALGLPAQIIIGEDDMPDASDTLRYRTTLAEGVDLTHTGAGVTWDMRALQPLQEAADTTVRVSATPLLYQFYFNNPILYPQNRADYGVRGTDFALQQLTLSDVYDYHRADANGFFNVGFGANVNGLPTSVRRQPVDRIFAFPLGYSDTDVYTSAFELSVPTLLYFGQDQVRTSEVDGWGTLILPADTFEVLRVKSVLQRTDTIYVSQLGMGLRLPEPETIEYKWIAAGMGKPVLEVVTVGGVPATAEFHYSPEDISTAVAARQVEVLNAFPNPASNELFVSTSGMGHLALRDISGRIVLEHTTHGGPLQRLDVGGLAEGSYVLESIGEERSMKVTVVVRR